MDEIRELSLQLYLPLTAMLLEFTQGSTQKRGLMALDLISDHQLYQHLDTKNDQTDFIRLFDDRSALNAACLKKCKQMYFLDANGVIGDAALANWLSAKGIALLYRYSDDQRYLLKLIEDIGTHRETGVNVIKMLSKDKSYHDMAVLIDLIIVLNDPDLRLTGLTMLKRAKLDTYQYCELTNALVYGLLSADGHRQDFLKVAKTHLDEIEDLMSQRHGEKDILLYAKIKSNLGAYGQAHYKLSKDPQDIVYAISCHKEALKIRISADSPAMAQSLMTLASDYYYVYSERHQIDDLKTSLDYHLKAYALLKDDPTRYKNLIRIAGTRLELAQYQFSNEAMNAIYDDLSTALVLAEAADDQREIRHIRTHFKDSLTLFRTRTCEAELYNKIYRLAEEIDSEDGYLCDLVKKNL